MVVFEEDSIEEPEAMVVGTPCGYSGFLKSSPAGSRLAGVVNLGFTAFRYSTLSESGSIRDTL